MYVQGPWGKLLKECTQRNGAVTVDCAESSHVKTVDCTDLTVKKETV